MVRRQPLIAGVFLCLLLFMSLSPIANSESLEQKDSATEDYVSARSTTTWSGIVDLTSNYYVDIQDELLITSCTNVTMSSGVRIVVDGRITIQGTPTCPVVLSSSSTSTSDHEGIQFNSSSNGRGSIINHLHIEDSIYGLTLYGSDPVLNNVTIFNPDRVGIDMFGSSSPVIRDLHIEQAGRLLPFQNDWRYGIGMSVGSGSTPIVERAYFTDHLLRGLNLWGGSGGIFRDIVMDNISGATLGEPTGVWVEDSVPLFEDLRIDKSDTGIIVRHIDDSGNTRGVFRDVVITNSMYRGVYIDKDNHFNYTNYETADFTNLSVLGTGSAGAKTANIAEAAIEVNATGAWLENVLVDDSSSVGVRLHYVDSSTTFRNLTINDAGEAGKGPHSAGLAITSSYFAAHLEDVEISGSPGPALWSSSGGAVQGTDWHFHNNSEHGLYIDSATVVVDGLDTNNNGYSGAHVYDSRYVTLTNVTSENDGSLGVTPLQTAGISFKKSNDLESTSGDVTCRTCEVYSSSGHGVYVEDSVDLWLENLTVSDIGSSFTPVYIDNGGLTTGSQGGRFHILGANIQHESTTEYAVYIEQAAGRLDDVSINGNHSGIFWDANHNGAYPSTLSNTVLRGTECLKLVNHPNLGGYGNSINSDCAGKIFLENADVNFSNLLDSTGSHVLDLDASSALHLHQPSNIDLTIANIPSGATIDVAWDVTIWVVNNLSNGVPSAFANVSFSQFEPSVSKFTNDIGTTQLTDFIGQRWSNTGASTHNDVTVNCGYDSVSNSTTAVLNSDQIMYCRLDLDNQEPFLMWTSPQDGAIFPSQGAVVFNASDTWDLDEDELTFSWSSNLDGDIESSCSGTWVSPNGPSNGVPFTANTNDQWACGLSDGLHTLTLEVCDDAGHCVSETRTIELTNLAPELNVTFEPGLTQFSELIMPQTGTVVINTTGTFDPEGDDFACLIQFGGYNRQGTGWGNVYTCPQELSYTFDHFTDDPPASFFLTVIAFDDVGNNDTYSVEVKLYNEMPESSFTLERNGTASEDIIFFNGSSSYDPEGNDVSFEWWSNVDGTLMIGNDIDNISWDGYLSRGVHLIELRVTDNRMEHGGQMSVYSELITIDNSVPKAVIEDLDVFDNLDSSILIPFSANGSGDWDSACSTFPTEGVWHCSEIEPAAGSEFLQIVWVSDVDGLLTPEGEDWLTFEERLSPGEHVITLSISDGINPVVTTTRSLSVSTSAPVLGLDSPQNNSVYSSSEMILFDARSSIDYDGDEFTMTVREYDSVTETYVPLLTDVNASITHSINLDAGEQDVQIELIDSTGAIRIEYVHLIIEASDPVAVILSPSNLESIDPGATILFEGDSSDADGDLVVREWRLWPSTTQVSNGQVTVLSTQSTFSQVFAPGSHHISLYVEDARGAVTQDHINFTVRSSLPELVRTSLQLSQTEFVSGEIVTLEVSIQLIDADGSTDDVRVDIDHLIQSWSFNLSDADGDSVWTGSIEFQPEGEGSPSLKVIATDGEGDNANIDILSEPLKVVGEEADGFLSTPVLIGAVSLVLLVGLLITIQRRRQANAEMKLIDTWGVFGNGMEDETDSEEKESDNSEEEKLDWDNV